MIDRTRILELIPHQGTMCLLYSVLAWSVGEIECHAFSHLSPDNPLRSNGRLGALAGVEYGLQAACLHGALLAGGERQAPGYLGALRDLRLLCDRLDDPELGTLAIRAVLELRQDTGMIYRFAVISAHGPTLVDGRASIVLPIADR
jgi:predicted hotdog family 3-hydroxylacyl-ACP dehydratase